MHPDLPSESRIIRTSPALSTPWALLSLTLSFSFSSRPSRAELAHAGAPAISSRRSLIPSARTSTTSSRTSSTPPHASLELFPAGIDGPTTDRHGSTTRAPPLRVDPLLRSSSAQIDRINGFVVSSSTFPTPFPGLFSVAPCAARTAVHHEHVKLTAV